MIDETELDLLPESRDSRPDNDHIRRLTASEQQVVQAQVDVPAVKIGYFSLYRYATKTESLIMAVSAFAAMAGGAAFPLMTLVIGNLTGSFSKFYTDPSIIHESVQHTIINLSMFLVYIGIGMLVSYFVGMVGFSYTGESMTQKIRELYLQAVFRQNIAFFDFLGSGEITTRITADLNLVQDGVSHKVTLVISGISMFVSAIIVSFVRSWMLALVMLSSVIAMWLVLGILGSFMRTYQTKSVNAYATAGSLAEEAISSSRNVTAFGTQPCLVKKYDAVLDEAAQFDLKAKATLGLMIACAIAILNMQYGLAFWQGSRWADSGDLTISQILTVTMSSMAAGGTLHHITPHIGTFGLAVAAATKIFSTIERKSPIDPGSETGDEPDNLSGKIQFRDIKHVYPSRPERPILDDFNLIIDAGKIVAIVGSSGSGKSTLLGLLERFYLPIAGKVLLDGRDISTLNLRWLRRNMSLVSQEPVLFNNTIHDCIEHGLVGTEYENASSEIKGKLIEDAARTANAYDFINRLPQKFQTHVGERGSLLSGGQKQRIAIARAVVSDPKILLLDEATASLDTRSESAVQKALDAASKGRTTIVIAHRLSTIRHADNIVVMVSGKIVEEGTHKQLLGRKTVYYSLVQAQELIGKPVAPLESSQNEQDMGVFEKSEKSEPLRNIQSMESQHQLNKTGTVEPTHPDSEVASTTWQLMKFIWTINNEERRLIYLGIVFAILAGFLQPIQAIFFGHSIDAISGHTKSSGGHGINFWCLMFLMLALVALVINTIQGVALSFGSARLIRRARSLVFRSILRQDMSFFDTDEVTSGSLSSFLATEPNRLAGISGAILGSLLTATATILGGFAIAASFGWKLALVSVSTVPFLLACGYWRFQVIKSFDSRMQSKSEAAAFACEVASSIRTVASLTLEPHLLNQYCEKLKTQTTGNLRFSAYSSFLFALSNSLSMFAMALAFWYGGSLILDGQYSLVQFFVCFVAIILSSQTAGGLVAYVTDVGDARSAAQRVHTLLNRRPLIDSWSTEGRKIDAAEGKIEFRDVHFAYPGRPFQKVLGGVNLTALPGQFIALVGASGCGKSTAMGLLERFYDPTSGSIILDDVPIPEYNLQDYRSQMALVSQETMLYTGTIRENILADDDTVPESAIVQACKDANIFDYISSLPDGLNTLVGAKGMLLSGGQRQRLAIARALLRNPKLLLLDEATSSLDSTSEAAVQAALDKASKGRTTIAIAHRLSTVQHADCIYVFDNGRVVEKGRHEDLVAKGGVYWELARLQELGV
ncbi:leptomycin B resistance protein pmd1 [Mytilinidion resinicola]|uniref:Leptomycin B resistance protein pmd1 n=1 Tax=Mytilinidion resinicola TaxID=574789 RepID=A0A6A6Y8J7_9PEZI|nr:leptomycin B resistance protein pmd1 [Mytilinidion resinicola]KAF2805142.1 leptomycin B resistance protein pmd1 [Mytilinidion resinicola]